MIALDASFLVDYLDGAAAARGFLERNRNRPLFSPTLALFEVYNGAARSDRDEHLEEVIAGLDWIEPLPLTESAAREAAEIRGELHEAGEPVNLGDVLIAGVCRDVGAKIVSRDDHFDRIPGVEVLRY